MKKQLTDKERIHREEQSIKIDEKDFDLIPVSVCLRLFFEKKEFFFRADRYGETKRKNMVMKIQKQTKHLFGATRNGFHPAYSEYFFEDEIPIFCPIHFFISGRFYCQSPNEDCPQNYFHCN